MADAAWRHFTVSLPFDRRAGPRRPGRLTGPRQGARQGGHPAATARWPPCWRPSITWRRSSTTGEFVFAPGDEDIHTAVERRVTELVGDVGAKLHTGRSRNDQVATDLRLWCRRSLIGVADESSRCRTSLAQRARRPATSTCRATPTCSGPSPCCWPTTCWPTGGPWPATSTASSRPSTASTSRPLGAGALAGSSLPLDPDYVAAELGFHGRFENSLDAVSDRDFVAEALFDLALLGVHLSRMGEEIVLWSTEEFGFCTSRRRLRHRQLDAAAEEEPRRGRAGAGQGGPLVGHLTGVLVTLKGLPLAYNRDLQEDKEPLFDAVAQVIRRAGGPHRVGGHGGFDVETHASRGRRTGGAAVDLAEWLVAGGMPFRQAHGLVGGSGPRVVERHVPLAELVAAHPAWGGIAGSARAGSGCHPAHPPEVPDRCRYPPSSSVMRSVSTWTRSVSHTLGSVTHAAPLARRRGLASTWREMQPEVQRPVGRERAAGEQPRPNRAEQPADEDEEVKSPPTRHRALQCPFYEGVPGRSVLSS